ncbi:MAG: MMPL family transporter, partial [Fidelibacterota bacterium]
MSRKALNSKLADGLLRFPLLWIGFIIAITLLLGGFAGRVRQDYTLENMYPKTDEEFAYFRWFKEEFEPDDNIIMVGFESPMLWTDISAWHAIDTLTSRFRNVEGVQEVMSLTTFEDVRGAEGELIVETLVEPFPEDQSDLARLRQRIMTDPILSQYLISPDGQTTVIYVELGPAMNSHETRRAVISRIKAITADYPQYAFHYSGIPYLRDQYIELMKRENVRGNGMVVPVAIILLYVTFRTVRGIVLPLTVI